MTTSELALRAYSDHIHRTRREAAEGYRLRRLARMRRRQQATGCA